MKKLVFILLSISFLIILVSINFNNIINNDKKSVVTTSTYITDIVKNIGKDKLIVDGLMGPGINPHNFQAAPNDLNLINNSDLIIYGGLNLEGKFGDILGDIKRDDLKVLDSSKDIGKDKLIIVSENGKNIEYDPHIWFDISIWKIVINTIKEEIINIDPDNSHYYINNYNEYLNSINELEKYIIQRVNELDIDQRKLITAHDAFSYFGRAYGFDVYGIQGLNALTEAGTNDISNLTNIIINNKIPSLFIEKSVSPKLVNALLESVIANGYKVKIGGDLYSDSLGDGVMDSYINVFKHNVDSIVDGLRGKNE